MFSLINHKMFVWRVSEHTTKQNTQNPWSQNITWGCDKKSCTYETVLIQDFLTITVMVDFFTALFMHPSSTRTHHPFLVILTISFMSADAAEVGKVV